MGSAALLCAVHGGLQALLIWVAVFACGALCPAMASMRRSLYLTGAICCYLVTSTSLLHAQQLLGGCLGCHRGT